MKKLTSTILSIGIIAGSVCVFAASEAEAAAAKCGNRAKLVKILEKKYKEVPVAAGLSQKSTEAFEVFASEEGSWTVIMTRTNGMTCIMAAGHSWRDLPKQIAGMES